MIELHNHLAYNIIPCWDVPKTFKNRDQWRRHDDYTKKMTGPLRILGSIDGYLQAIVRFTECKLLFSGVTSSQGITLAASPKIRSLYKGLVRNVEQTLDKDLPGAKTKIADVKKASDLMKQLDKKKTYILHLAEGIPESANKHFKALKFPNSSRWAINEYLAGIHAVGLFPDDYKILAQNGGNIVWSPLSNLLLYGQTTDIALAKSEGINLAIGSDWSPSGSKNLLNEIKVAKLYSDAANDLFTNEELVRMVTTQPAQILQWQDKAGSIEPGKKADLFVIRGKSGDEYEQFVNCREKDIHWVLIGGIPRFGISRLMDKFTGRKETLRIKKLKRKLYLDIDDQDNAIDLNVGFKTAESKLKQGLKKLPQLAVQYENQANAFAMGASGSAMDGTARRMNWVIEHDHMDHEGSCGRHHIPFEGEETTTETMNAAFVQGATPLSQQVDKMLLDVSNVEDDAFYFKGLARQKNLPEHMKIGLPLFYDREINVNDAERYKVEISEKEKSSFNEVYSLKSFLQSPGFLTINDKLNIIDQATTILNEAYVHLIQKNALYATNPVEHLRVLRMELLNSDEEITELGFHRRMIEIFTSLRDLHTLYQLPEPFASKVAYLPFFMEMYQDKENEKFIVSKIIGKKKVGQFEEGVEVTHWNGTPIYEAVYANGRNYAGSNEAARFARGLDSMTFRPLSVMLPPQSEWVNLSFNSKKGKKANKRFQWKVGSQFDLSKLKVEDLSDADSLGLADGHDYQSSVVQDTKRMFFAREIIPKSPALLRKGMVKPGDEFILTKKPFNHFFKARKIPMSQPSIGYIRVYSFNHPNHLEIAREFERLIGATNSSKLIIDLRNNPGGNILAAEFMLQVLSNKRIKPQNAQFVNSNLSQFICDRHSPSQVYSGLNFEQWNSTLKSIRTTGANFSVGYPITPTKDMHKFVAKKPFECVLITDALCYSASDIFASGFKDNGIGKILGIAKNTGAGGANVWSLSTIYHLSKTDKGGSDFVNLLPHGADIKVAVRRMIRSGESAGIPLEDLGVQPDEIHQMTRADLLESNKDLIRKAISMIS